MESTRYMGGVCYMKPCPACICIHTTYTQPRKKKEKETFLLSLFGLHTKEQIKPWISKRFYNKKTCNSQIKQLTQCWFWLLLFSWFHSLPIFPSISQPEMVKYVKLKIAGNHYKKLHTTTQASIWYYIWMEVGINHSNYPNVAIKPRSEMPLMHSGNIRLCRISITCHMKITIMNLQ